MVGTWNGYKNQVLASLGNQQALQNQQMETAGFNMFGNNTSSNTSFNMMKPTDNTQNQNYNPNDMYSQALNKEVETGLGTRLGPVMSDTDKQKYLNSLSNTQYNQMLQYKNEGYGFMASKALLEQSYKLDDPTATGTMKYKDYAEKDAYYQGVQSGATTISNWYDKYIRGYTTGALKNYWDNDLGFKEDAEKGNLSFADKFANLTLGNIIEGADKIVKGIGDIADTTNSYLNAGYDRIFKGYKTDANFYDTNGRNLGSEVVSLLKGGMDTALGIVGLIPNPANLIGVSALSTDIGGELAGIPLGRINKGVTYVVENTPGLKQGYNALDDQAKEELVDGLSLVILGKVTEGAKAKVDAKAGPYINATKQMVKNGLEGAKNSMASEIKAETFDMYDGVTGKKGTVSENGYEGNVVKRTVQAGIDGFKENAKIRGYIREDTNPLYSSIGEFKEGTPGGEKTSGTPEDIKTNSSFKEKVSDVKDTVYEKQLANRNRMTAGDIRKFEDRYGESYTRRMVDRGFTKSYENNVKDIIQYANEQKATKDKALSLMRTQYENVKEVNALVDYIADRLSKTDPYGLGQDTPKIANLITKYQNGGLTLSDIDYLRSWYGDNVRLGFYKENNSVEVEKADIIYSALKEFLEREAQKNGFGQLKQINQEIARAHAIIIGTTKFANGRSANDTMSIKDAMLLAGSMSNPKTRPMLIIDIALKQSAVKDKILQAMFKGKSKREQKQIKADFEKILKIQDKLEQERAINEMMDKFNIEVERVQEALTRALPEIKEGGVDATDKFDLEKERYGIKERNDVKPNYSKGQELVNNIVEQVAKSELSEIKEENVEALKEKVVEDLSDKSVEVLDEIAEKLEADMELEPKEEQMLNQLAEEVAKETNETVENDVATKEEMAMDESNVESEIEKLEPAVENDKISQAKELLSKVNTIDDFDKIMDISTYDSWGEKVVQYVGNFGDIDVVIRKWNDTQGQLNIGKGGVETLFDGNKSIKESEQEFYKVDVDRIKDFIVQYLETEYANPEINTVSDAISKYKSEDIVAGFDENGNIITMQPVETSIEPTKLWVRYSHNPDTLSEIPLHEFKRILTIQEDLKEQAKNRRDELAGIEKAETEAREKQEAEEKTMNEYLDTITHKATRTKTQERLRMKTRFQGKVVTRREFIETGINDLELKPDYIDTGKKYPNGSPKLSYRLADEKGIGYDLTKGEYDYARFLEEKKNPEPESDLTNAEIDHLFGNDKVEEPNLDNTDKGKLERIISESGGQFVVDTENNTVSYQIKGGNEYLPIIQNKVREVTHDEALLLNNIKNGNNAPVEYNTDNLTTNNSNNGGEQIGTISGETNQGISGEYGRLSGTESVSGNEMNNTETTSGAMYGDEKLNEGTIERQPTGFTKGLTRASAREINQKSKDILNSHNFSTNPNDYTAEELSILRQYEGAGGLTNAGEDTTGALDQFYTPQAIINKIWGLVDMYKSDGAIDVVEPSVGPGRMIRDREGENYTGYEIDKIPGAIAQILHPSAKIRIRDFEDNFMDFTGRVPQPNNLSESFDIVVGNPPYSNRQSKQQKAGLETKIKRMEEFFIKKSVDMLRPNGVLSMIIPSTFLTNPMSHAREQILKNARIIDAYRLPEGVFPFTQVGTDILVLKKTTSEGSDLISDNRRFAEHPEKVLGEEKERYNRFGRLEKYIDGGANPLAQLDKIITEKGDKIEGLSGGNDITNAVNDAVVSNGGLDGNGVLTTVSNTPAGNQKEITIETMPNGDVAVTTDNGETTITLSKDNGELVSDDPAVDMKKLTKEIEGAIKKTPDEKAEDYENSQKQTVVKSTPTSVAKKPKTAVKRTNKSVKIENQTIISGDKDDMVDIHLGSADESPVVEGYISKRNINLAVEGVNPESDIQNLNYYKGNAVLNMDYFAGDIYEKLDTLEKEKSSMSPELYKKQAEGLRDILPERLPISEIHFSPLDKRVMETPTTELGEKRNGSGYEPDPDNHKTVKDVFLEWFRRNVSSSTVDKSMAVAYINGDTMRAKGSTYGLSEEQKKAQLRHEKSVTMEKTNEIFNEWISTKLEQETQEKIVDTYNRQNRAFVNPDYANMPLNLHSISQTFNKRDFKLNPGQKELVSFLLSRGSGIGAHGVGHGKTIAGVVSTREAQLRGWNKKPLIVAPGPTLYAQRVRTIKELYPDWEIVNLGGLTVGDLKRLRSELGPNPKDWIKDGQVAILSMSGFTNIEFSPETTKRLEAKLTDVMDDGEKKSARQEESFKKKVEQMLAPSTGKADKHHYSEDSEFLQDMFKDMLDMPYDKFLGHFTAQAHGRYPTLSLDTIDADAKAFWLNKPITYEDLGIDHITVDEMHNFKNVFTGAKINEDEKGHKDVNRYGQIIQGSPSARGQRMYLATQYIMENNGNRNVFGLTATPFNNQPIEVYNMLAFVGKERMEELGITNINDFFSRYAEFREGPAPKADGTEIEYKFIMKDFSNAQELQRMITEMINYKGDNKNIVKPEKLLRTPILKMSELQRENQHGLELLANDKSQKGSILKATNGMISNLVSPFIVAGTRAPTSPKDFLDNSPKLKFIADTIKQLRDSGKKDGVFIYMPIGKEFHEIYREAIAEHCKIDPKEIGIINSLTSGKKDEIAKDFREGKINVLIGGKNTMEGIDLQTEGYITAITQVGWNNTERTQVNGRVWRQGNFRNHVVELTPLLENSADVIFMGKHDQKGSRINNIFEFEGRLYGGEGDLSAEDLMFSLLTEPDKKANTKVKMEVQRIEKDMSTVSTQADRLKELRDKIQEADEDLEGTKKKLEEAKNAGRTWQIPSFENTIKSITKARKWLEKYKLENETIPTLTEIKTSLEELNNQYEALKEEKFKARSEENVKNLTEQFRQEQEEMSKNTRTIEQYLSELKADSDNLKKFGDQDELKSYLNTKNNSDSSF